MRGLSRHPSGPLPPVDVLEAARVDARRLLRPPPLAASHHHWVLTPPLAAAMAAGATAAPRAAARRAAAVQRPWRAAEAGPPLPSPRPLWGFGAGKGCREPRRGRTQ